jgi:DNA-binding HxlR family transcriptional regulator
MSPIDFNGLDTVVHGPVRLAVLTTLQVNGPLDFTALKKRLDLSDGALGSQLLKLEEIRYIASRKSFVLRRPNTTYRITAAGRRALGNYVNQMQQVIDAVRTS